MPEVCERFFSRVSFRILKRKNFKIKHRLLEISNLPLVNEIYILRQTDGIMVIYFCFVLMRLAEIIRGEFN